MHPSEIAIKRLASNVDSAYNASDAATMASYWTEDGLNINPFGDRFVGRAMIEADLRAGFQGLMKGSQHRLSISEVSAVNDVTAVADGVATITGIVGGDGNPMEPLPSQFSMICTPASDGEWKIAQMRAYQFIPKHG